MNHAIPPGTLPPPPGMEKEEPEISQEADIAPEDDGAVEQDEVSAQRE